LKKIEECSTCCQLPDKVYLNVDAKDKDEVKELGAKWDPYLKKWWVAKSQFCIHVFNKWFKFDHEQRLQNAKQDKERKNRIYIDVPNSFRDQAKLLVQA